MPACPLIRLTFLKNPIFLWFMAILITVASAIYQRQTGPTYPVEGELTLAEKTIHYSMTRSATTGSDTPVVLRVPDSTITAYLQYRRYKSYDDWTLVPMTRQPDGKLVASLPDQPAAGKLMYRVLVKSTGRDPISLTGETPIIIRYKGAVPAAVLIPHILFMFGAMLLSNRTGLEVLSTQGHPQQLMYWTIAFVILGGLIFGPIVQKYAFDAFWTGVPFGYDLTDNKTLIAFLGWLFAWWKNRGDAQSRGAILFATLLMLLIFMIPHSVLGSELDYTQLQ